jgi:hypothetical protein
MQEDDAFEAIEQDEFMGAPKREPDQIFLIAMLDRPGVPEVLQELEWRYFRPGTPANGDYTLVILRFPYLVKVPELTWIVAMFPRDYLETIQESLRKSSFKMNSGIPRVLPTCSLPEIPTGMPALVVSAGPVADEMAVFPLEMAPNVFTLEGMQKGVAGVIVMPDEKKCAVQSS